MNPDARRYEVEARRLWGFGPVRWNVFQITRSMGRIQYHDSDCRWLAAFRDEDDARRWAQWCEGVVA